MRAKHKKDLRVNMILTNQAVILAALARMTDSEGLSRLLDKASDATRELVENWVDAI